ncbi:hypothetical protein Nepgr_003701 [Nepenthes gracilis]|uniref:Uncharacterized protein n=1 Tax=Nepenthes gracilis TaxID=150966 RepID=A0AAD3S035_NEPGR|nr:hypothetical protein Nepgr_003701 [Nepenthes gracilis]
MKTLEGHPTAIQDIFQPVRLFCGNLRAQMERACHKMLPSQCYEGLTVSIVDILAAPLEPFSDCKFIFSHWKS